MERPLSPLPFVLAALIAVATLLSASVLLPHDRYYRFQAHDNVSTRKADWIYERLHFDATPIDVALIGTSRMAGGLSGPTIERDYCAATGRRIRVANLAIPMTGRNMHYVIAREAARTKAPALTVVELNDVETRKPHPGFIYLADARDVVTAPAAINLHYLSDLARLPGRQAALFVQTLLRSPALRAEFSPHAYRGADLDLTAVQTMIDGSTRSRDVFRSRDEMERLRADRLERTLPVQVVPGAFAGLEYRFARRYFRKINHAAARRGGAVAFAYLPAYGAPAPPPALLDALGLADPAFNVGGAPANDHRQWLDATHLNARGAAIASRRFARQLATRYPALGRDDEPCP